MTHRRDLIKGGLSVAAAAGMLGLQTASAQTSTRSTTTAAATTQGGYRTSNANQSLDIINLYDLEAEAAKVIPKPQFGFISGGSGDQWTLRENTRSFDDRQILPDYLVGIDQPDMSTTLLGSKVKIPIFVPPMSAHGIAHHSAELASSKGAADAGALFTAQTMANVPLEDIAKASNGPRWFQLYYMKDSGANRELIQRAKAAGATAIVFTVDLEWAGNREADKRNGFVFPPELQFPNIPNAPKGATLAEFFQVFNRTLTFKDLDFIMRESQLPVILKGVLTPKNAREAIARGAAAIQVSNHGGRQLDNVPAAFTALPHIVEAAEGKVPVFMDGGVRRGVHVFKALAMGASAVGVGRPVLYGLSLGGAPGVTSVLNTLATELALCMKLAGTPTIADIQRKYVS